MGRTSPCSDTGTFLHWRKRPDQQQGLPGLSRELCLLSWTTGGPWFTSGAGLGYILCFRHPSFPFCSPEASCSSPSLTALTPCFAVLTQPLSGMPSQCPAQSLKQSVCNNLFPKPLLQIFQGLQRPSWGQLFFPLTWAGVHGAFLPAGVRKAHYGRLQRGQFLSSPKASTKSGVGPHFLFHLSHEYPALRLVWAAREELCQGT